MREDAGSQEVLAELKQKSSRGGFHTAVAQGGTYVLQMLGTVILARLLAPADFGLVAMVVVIIALLGHGQDAGLPAAAIQKSRLSQGELSGLFWLSALAGVGLAALMCAIGPVLAWLYGEERLVAISLALAPVFLLKGMALQHRALMSRHMRFGTVALIELLSVAMGVMMAVAAGFLGAGYWALVVQHLGIAAALLGSCWALNPWRPGLPSRWKEMGGLFEFARDLTISKFLGQSARSLDRIVVGMVCGAADLGYYSRAAHLLLLPLGQVVLPLGRVVVPVLSRLQDDPANFRKFFYKTVNVIGFAIFLPVGVMAALADELVHLLLGPGWSATASLFTILAPAAVGQALFNCVTWGCTACGRADRLRRWSLISAPLLGLAFVIGVWWGTTGVAWAYTFGFIGVQLPGIGFLLRGTPLSAGRLLGAVWRPTLLAIGLFWAVSVGRIWLSEVDPIVRMGGASLVGIAWTLGLLLAWAGARYEAMALLATAKSIKGG